MPRSRRRVPLAVTGAAVVAFTLAACATGAGPAEPTTGTGEGGEAEELAVAVASFDVAVGEDRRLLAAVFLPDRRLLGGGAVTFQLGFLGDEPRGDADLTQEVTAPFLPVPGVAAVDSDAPAPLADPLLAGVYAGRVDLDRPGYWGLRVRAELADGRRLEGRTVVRVLPETEVVDVGDPAPRVRNATTADVAAGRVEPRALDSRLTSVEDVDRASLLHATTLEDAIAAGRPVVMVVATPVYCQSRVCGPLTETMEAFARRVADRVAVIHLEVWSDFETQRLNDAAAAWISTEAGGNEPWVFLVGADGIVLARWDNVLDLDELESRVAALLVDPAPSP